MQLGAEIFEHTPVTAIERGQDLVLKTPSGSVRAKKLVLGTNAYSHLIPQVRRKQVPAWTYMVATEPLNDRQFESIGWEHRQGVEDARNLIHYYRISPDNRLLMGGGPVGLSFGGDMDRDALPDAWQHLEDHIGHVFPGLKGIKITHRWGGPFSVTVDLTPALGYLGDKRVVYSVGCIGHGVSLTQLNGQTIRDLVLERQSELTDVFFVNRRLIPWPPEPFRLALSGALRGYLQLEDWAFERNMPKT